MHTAITVLDAFALAARNRKTPEPLVTETMIRHMEAATQQADPAYQAAAAVACAASCGRESTVIVAECEAELEAVERCLLPGGFGVKRGVSGTCLMVRWDEAQARTHLAEAAHSTGQSPTG